MRTGPPKPLTCNSMGVNALSSCWRPRSRRRHNMHRHNSHRALRAERLRRARRRAARADGDSHDLEGALLRAFMQAHMLEQQDDEAAVSQPSLSQLLMNWSDYMMR